MPRSSDDYREYYVSPRYLAGSTFTGDPAIRPLLDAGLQFSSDELGNCFATAPDQTLRLSYLPEGEDDALWQIAAYSPSSGMPEWLVTFQESTPTEIVQEFTTALAAKYQEGPDSYLSTGSCSLAALGAPLTEAGWSSAYDRPDLTFRAPDGLASVHLRRMRLDHTAELEGEQEQWLVLAGPPGRQWYATASTSTPPDLVTAINTALASPTPAIREGIMLRRVPSQATVVPVEPMVPTPLDVRRALAAKARSPLGSATGTGPVAPAAPRAASPKGAQGRRR